MIKRILVGLGGADYTASAINQAVALAMAHDAEVTGVSVNDPEHVTPTLSMAIGEGALIYPFPEADLKKAKERIELATQELIDACRGAGIRYRVLREVGEPFSVMTSEARYHDLMVMGNSAKNLLLRRLFGETALDVIRNANLPLFLAQ